MMAYAPWQRQNEEAARQRRERHRPVLQLPLECPTQVTGSSPAPPKSQRGVCDIDEEFRVDLAI